ncbi:hypothetical protein AJ79_02093 [Helicocarpus griseus UAMH5409]|uniref:Pathway-specific nitrogen regulator n=1 Tax=Helicocarpus griseus UAMH5409 TaxID=1447875 RepID=A0A2B7Y357_9EURO|nr:hypothetical protein AJ79_02093 [Helicocarpus griseus UAMH5409]
MADLAPETVVLNTPDAGTRENDKADLSPAPPAAEIKEQEELPLLAEEVTDAVPESDTSPVNQSEEADVASELHTQEHDTDHEVERPQSSSSSSQRSSTFTGEDDFFDREGGMGRTTGTASSRSSISSLPGSVVVCPPEKHESYGTITPSSFRGHYMQHYSDQNDEEPTPVNSNGSKRGNYASRLSKAAPGVRDRDSPFRHPSSVRALQMGDEESDGYGYGYEDEDLTPSRRRHRGGARHSCQSVSGISIRSLGSTPPSAKRHHKSPRLKEETAQKEYPLVLLHCTLLPPSLSLSQALGQPSAQVLKEVLPEKYWARWKLLEDKIINSGVLRDRGLLISHPQDLYDVLEERLLESLELVRPRSDYGHFLGKENGDSADDRDDEPASEKGDEGDGIDGCEGGKCADCGARVLDYLDGEKRKWDIRVYAANGLMGAGAWAAVWREMEKVDVEIGLTLPVGIKRELERRTVEEQAIKMEEEMRLAEEDKRRREIYGEPTQPTQEAIGGLEDDNLVQSYQLDFDRSSPSFESPDSPPPVAPSVSPYEQEHQHEHEQQHPHQHDHEHEPMNAKSNTKEVDLQTLCANYIRVLASDKRNVALAFLSILVLYLSICMPRREHIPTYHAPQLVLPSVSTPMVMAENNHNPPPVAIPPIIRSAEPQLPTGCAAAESRVVHAVSGCQAPPILETPSVAPIPPQQECMSQPAPSHSAPMIQCAGPSVETVTHIHRPQPTISKPSAVSATSNSAPICGQDSAAPYAETGLQQETSRKKIESNDGVERRDSAPRFHQNTHSLPVASATQQYTPPVIHKPSMIAGPRDHIPGYDMTVPSVEEAAQSATLDTTQKPNMAGPKDIPPRMESEGSACQIPTTPPSPPPSAEANKPSVAHQRQEPLEAFNVLEPAPKAQAQEPANAPVCLQMTVEE